MSDEIDQSVETSTEDSGVVRALRQQIKDLKADLASRPAREDLMSEVRAQLKRESDAVALLIEQGQPSGLAEFMLSKIGDADITAEAVSGFLQGLGLDTKAASSEGDQQAPNQQLAEVTDLASRVSAIASNTPADTVSDRIAQAQSMSELEAIMAEAGAGQSQV